MVEKKILTEILSKLIPIMDDLNRLSRDFAVGGYSTSIGGGCVAVAGLTTGLALGLVTLGISIAVSVVGVGLVVGGSAFFATSEIFFRTLKRDLISVACSVSKREKSILCEVFYFSCNVIHERPFTERNNTLQTENTVRNVTNSSPKQFNSIISPFTTITSVSDTSTANHTDTITSTPFEETAISISDMAPILRVSELSPPHDSYDGITQFCKILSEFIFKVEEEFELVPFSVYQNFDSEMYVCCEKNISEFYSPLQNLLEEIKSKLPLISTKITGTTNITTNDSPGSNTSDLGGEVTEDILKELFREHSNSRSEKFCKEENEMRISVNVVQ
eukprot:TRINITY_DN902_c0_g1_i3.p1 TRINITY_DN902_c0_g1~~TRINITY_DN902_c0_g1_i3.p1  ORF type:complete len:332 (+),score=66.21 TRINITY_DN902_c0_g1_i3:881-1876(+)